jgi:hypothetical protein
VRHRREITLRVLEIQVRHAAARGQIGLERRIRAALSDLKARASSGKNLAWADDHPAG